MNEPITIHFVCHGNIYRSRMAEVYAKSLGIPGVVFSSSGTRAGRKYEGKPAISPMAEYALGEHGLDAAKSPHSTQTTDQLLRRQKLVIFLNPNVAEEAERLYRIDMRKADVWNVDDFVDIVGPGVELEDIPRRKSERMARDAFRTIRQGVDRLTVQLSRGGWVDVVDEKNQPTRVQLPVEWATNNPAVWTRGCHVVVTTPKGYVVQKRSRSILFAPGRLDITLGGGVDPGETPLEAAVRETDEELGVRITAAQLAPLELRKWKSYHPKSNKHSQLFLYTYHLELDHEPMYRLQSSEVEEVRTLSPRRVQALLRSHYLKGFGPLGYGRAYYRDIVALADQRRTRTQ